MTTSQLLSLANEAREMAGKATRGPWICREDTARGGMRGPVAIFPKDMEGFCCIAKAQSMLCNGRGRSEGDPEFIAHSRLAVPVLAEAVIALMPFVQHNAMCQQRLGSGGQCSCGLEAALKSLEER